MQRKGTIIIQNEEGRMPPELQEQLRAEGYDIVYEEDMQSGNIPIGNGSMRLELHSHSLMCGEKSIHLTPNEFRILYTFAKSPNRVYSREQLITYALNDDFDGYDRTIDTYIKSIRKKIEPNPRKPQYIITVHGVGYKYMPDEKGQK